jgi:hypothetical protein
MKAVALVQATLSDFKPHLRANYIASAAFHRLPKELRSLPYLRDLPVVTSKVNSSIII